MTEKIKIDGEDWKWERKGDLGVPSMWSRKGKGGAQYYRRARRSGDEENAYGIPIGPIYDNWGDMQDAEDREFPLWAAVWAMDLIVDQLRKGSYELMNSERGRDTLIDIRRRLGYVDRRIAEALKNAGDAY